MVKRFRGVVLVIVMALAAGACQTRTATEPQAEQSFAAGSYMADLEKKGKIVIGVKFDVPQFGFLNPATSKPEGMDVDLGNIIAEELGVEAEFVEAISRNRIPFLQEDKVDLIISTMTITEERKKEIDFSNVYYVAGQRLLVKASSKITDVSSLNDEKAPVCTAKGSTSEKNIRIAAPDSSVTLQDGYSQCFQLLQNDQVQAVTTDDVILLGLMKSDPKNYRLAGGRFSNEPYGMGMKKGRSGFLEFINGVLTRVKNDGTWAKLYNEWVKPVAGEPGNPPPDEVKAVAPSPPA